MIAPAQAQLQKPDTTIRTEEVAKGGKSFIRKGNADVEFTTPDAKAASLKGRSLMLIRNVGHLMLDEGVLDQQGHPVPEGLLDCMITSAIAMHDLKRTGALTNSRANISVGITGVAGPGGGTRMKPVGTVHIACARENRAIIHEHLQLGEISRDAIRMAAVESALNLIQAQMR